MAKKLNLNATKRDSSGSGSAKRLRRIGIVPGVIYGSHQDNYSVQVVEKDFSELVHRSGSANMLLNLRIAGAKEPEKLTMVQAVQRDPLTGRVLHIDFHAVREDEEVTAHIALELLGEAVGVRAGGMLDHQVHTLEVRCKPGDMPERFELDVRHLEIGDAVHVSDIALPPGVEMVTDADVVVASVQEIKVLPSAEELAAEAAAAAVAGGAVAKSGESEAPAEEGGS